MWIVLGVGAIFFAILNVFAGKGNNASKWFGFISLSLTALTVCSFYYDAALLVVKEDWSALSDILPTISKLLWACVVVSIIVNSIPFFRTAKLNRF